ncbi:type II toxin-antitoxin system VapC family toxin [Argonema galeatum]|uniref:type II toxin-antitoxin system VapC family toxin n=1 Tax=Argonema galeatum TaxID=2942762 RepID=UPI002011E60A|nr:PIN domain-containing protein [Argonema galeatum]MCL1466017.1 PIN domain-containing protein [Argonema galeatum A003/A1]
MKVLFDTSVLVPALIVNHPKHSVCFSRLKAAESKQIQGFISTHSLAETYSVITRLPIQPRITTQQAQSIIVDVLQYLEVIPLLSNDYQIAINQMATLNIPGGGIFDALIAQAALKAEVGVILTLNPNHFTRLGSAIAALVQVPA